MYGHRDVEQTGDGRTALNKKLAEKGKIAIQDHGQPFWVRNIKVKAH